MGQATLDDDLFGEAATEMREDVEEHLDAARGALPSPEDVWETDASNVLGVLNGLRSALDGSDADEHLREAKKWYTMGERADAFEDAADLEREIEGVEELMADLAEAREQVGELTTTLPELKGSLEEFEAGETADAGADDEDVEDDVEVDEDAEADEGADAAEDEESEATAAADD